LSGAIAYCGPRAREGLTVFHSILLANLPFYPSRSFAPIGAVARETIEGQGEDGLGLRRELARDAHAARTQGNTLLQIIDWQWERMAPELTALGYHPGVPVPAGSFALTPAELP
jgi:hypothetical protein